MYTVIVLIDNLDSYSKMNYSHNLEKKNAIQSNDYYFS